MYTGNKVIVNQDGTMFNIRRAEEKDWLGIYPILAEVVGRGDTYAINPSTGEKDLKELWMIQPTATFVALMDEACVGTYYLKPNREGGGAHVCNAGYMVCSSKRRRGIGKAMCGHSLKTALNMGFEAMQYNLVVSTNEGAIKLWKSLGFFVVGTLPRAFRHPLFGPVDALVMYRILKPGNAQG